MATSNDQRANDQRWAATAALIATHQTEELVFSMKAWKDRVGITRDNWFYRRIDRSAMASTQLQRRARVIGLQAIGLTGVGVHPSIRHGNSRRDLGPDRGLGRGLRHAHRRLDQDALGDAGPLHLARSRTPRRGARPEAHLVLTERCRARRPRPG